MNIATDHDPTPLIALIEVVGMRGLAVLIALAWLTISSPKVRAAEVKLLRWTLRRLARLVVKTVRAYRPIAGNPSKEERRLLTRLTPSYWREHAEGRGLGGTITGRPRLTEAGIVCAVRMDGTWTVGKLRSAEDYVRNLLGLRTGLPLEIGPGRAGGWAEITIRTRTAVDGADLTWTPDVRGLGLDTVTGAPVDLDPYQRLLIAGESGAGKSVALRPLLAKVVRDRKSALVYVDAKRVEGALWRDRARVARDAAEIVAVAGELAAEMMARLEAMEDQGVATWTPTEARPRLVVVVDEGAEVMALAKDAMADFSSLARMGRAAEIHLWWATQKPTQGRGGGIDPQISAQMGVQLCLKVASPTEARTVLGEDATAEGWHANKLPKPGVVLLRGTGRGPVPVRVWHLEDAAVRDLPRREAWGTGAAPVAVSGAEMPSTPRKVPTPAPDTRSAVLDALRGAQGPMGRSEVVIATGRGKSSVHDALTGLVDDGTAVRIGSGPATRYVIATKTKEGAA